jgi:hypothetical protein
LATLEKWAEVLAVAAGPWKREEMRELAIEILETLLIDVAETSLRMVRQELRSEIGRCLASGCDPQPLVHALAQIARLSSETILTEATQSTVALPRPELEAAPVT